MELTDKKFLSAFKNADNALREVLRGVFGGRAPADRLLGGFLREHRQCGSRDRRFISESVYALLRYWGILRKFLPEERRNELESGVIRLARTESAALLFAGLYLDGRNLPLADELARAFSIPWPKPDHELPELEGKAAALARLFGSEAKPVAADLVPDWFRAALPPEFPFERFTADLAVRPPMWLRAQTANLDALTAELTAAGLTANRHEHIPGALAVAPGKVNLFTLEAFKRGDFEVQDLASQCIGLAAAPQPGERWLDACAGAGGKSLQLASLMQNRGKITASDVRSYKLDDLRVRARRAGLSNIETKEWDGKAVRGKAVGGFDGVLADAPCSCSGVWRRNPESRWTMKPEELTELAEIQRTILENVAPAVKPGGVLVYSTCSIFPQENGEVVAAFLAAHPEFALEEFTSPLTGEITPGTLQTYSFDGDCDSMFVARLRKRLA